jgi:hypothetical protein
VLPQDPSVPQVLLCCNPAALMAWVLCGGCVRSWASKTMATTTISICESSVARTVWDRRYVYPILGGVLGTHSAFTSVHLISSPLS